MRKRLLPLFLFAAAPLAACGNTTGPADLNIVGTWQSREFAPATVQMTLVESARAPTGAGRWLTPGDADAFRVTGAHIEQRVALLLDFDDQVRRDIEFFGVVRETTAGDSAVVLLVGELHGGGYRGDSIAFQRVRFPER